MGDHHYRILGRLTGVVLVLAACWNLWQGFWVQAGLGALAEEISYPTETGWNHVKGMAAGRAHIQTVAVTGVMTLLGMALLIASIRPSSTHVSKR